MAACCKSREGPPARAPALMGADGVRIPGIQMVVRHGKHHWQVMHAKKYLGYFSEFDDALQAKATEMGITSAALKNKYMESMKSMKSDDEPKQFKGITRIVRNGKPSWQSQDPTTSEYLGIADTYAGAAALLKDHHGEAPAVRPRKRWYPRSRQVEHFKVCRISTPTSMDTNSAI